jgi:hypothetical protein
MASLDPLQRLVLGRYWSEIFGGAAQRVSTSDLFVSIRARAQELGLSSVGVGASVVSTLRGYASRMVSAAGRLNKAADETSLGNTYIAEAPWARPLVEQNTMPIYNVTFQHTIELEDGSTVTKHQNMTIVGQLPPTVGDLRAQVESEAAILAAEGGAPTSGTPKGLSLGVDNLMITAV